MSYSKDFTTESEIYQKELTDYDQVRLPQPTTEKTFKRNDLMVALNSEFSCPICLDLIKKTMVTECLHRFCSECITKAIFKGNKECPTCRKKIISKRNLRSDPNLDSLIAAIWPDRTTYEEMQSEQMENWRALQNVRALQQSIKEGMREQAKHRRPQKGARTSVLSSVENLNATPKSRPMTSSCRGQKGQIRSSPLCSPDSGTGSDVPVEEGMEENDFSEEEDSSSSDFNSSSESSDWDDELGQEEEQGQFQQKEQNYPVTVKDFESEPEKKAEEKDTHFGESGTEQGSGNEVETIFGPRRLSTEFLGLPGMDMAFKAYERRTKPLGEVVVELKPLAQKKELISLANSFRLRIHHSAPLGELHSKLVAVVNNQMQVAGSSNGSGNRVQQMRLFIQTAPERLVQLEHSERIVSVLCLANRANFHDYPTIFFG